jgi:peptide/nickel transport system substrate-binding protein
VTWNHDNSAIEPALATHWAVSDDAREWIFHIRPGVYFHDGEHVDSAAVRATIEYYRDRPLGFFWSQPTEIDASDPEKIRLVYREPAPDVLRNQTLTGILSPRIVAGGSDAVMSHAVGTGPFKLSGWNRGRTLVLEANESYWGEGPFLERVELIVVSDEVSRFNALQSGVVDIVLNVHPAHLHDLKFDTSLHSDSVLSWTEGDLSLNCALAPTNDVRVRRAIAFALDRDAIVLHVLRSHAARLDSPVPRGTYGWDEPQTRYPFDPEKAKELLREAGYVNGVDLKMAVFAGVWILGEEVSQAVAAMLENVGIRVTLDILDPGVIGHELNSGQLKYHIVHLQNGWLSGGPIHLSIGHYLSQSRYTGARLVSLIRQSSTTADGPRRLELMRQVGDLFMSELPHIPLYQLDLTSVYRVGVSGFQTPKDGYMPFFGRTRAGS